MATFEVAEWLIDWILNQSQFAFDWDAGNSTKNLKKHGITCEEAESVFDQPEAIKPVFLCFTIRGTGIRIIHIRKMNQKERKLYAELCQK